MFKAADMKTMDTTRKSDYMKSILGEVEYEAQLHDWREEGREEERLKNAKAMEKIVGKLKEMDLSMDEISDVTGIPVDSLQG